MCTLLELFVYQSSYLSTLVGRVKIRGLLWNQSSIEIQLAMHIILLAYVICSVKIRGLLWNQSSIELQLAMHIILLAYVICSTG